MEEFSRRTLIRTAASGMILVPSVAHSQPSPIPPEWASVSPGVIDLAANSLIPIYNQERNAPGSTNAVSWAVTHGALSAMFRQWEDCGLSRYIQEHAIIDRAALASGPPLAVFDVASRFGMALPDDWWANAIRGLDSIRRPLEFPRGVHAMLQTTARHVNGPGEVLRGRRTAHKDSFSILPVQDWDLEGVWTKVGGIFLILSGAIALAFGSIAIAGVGLGIIAIGLAFEAL